jgi:hypothetical protein
MPSISIIPSAFPAEIRCPLDLGSAQRQFWREANPKPIALGIRSPLRASYRPPISRYRAPASFSRAMNSSTLFLPAERCPASTHASIRSFRNGTKTAWAKNTASFGVRGTAAGESRVAGQPPPKTEFYSVDRPSPSSSGNYPFACNNAISNPIGPRGNASKTPRNCPNRTAIQRKRRKNRKIRKRQGAIPWLCAWDSCKTPPGFAPEPRDLQDCPPILPPSQPSNLPPFQPSPHPRSIQKLRNSRLTTCASAATFLPRHERRGSQVVRRGSAKSLFIGSIPIRASKSRSAPAPQGAFFAL